jgi:sialate O-acetylesterase
VPRSEVAAPAAEVKAGWQQCGPETVGDFSAVAYFFGRDLQAARGVPVGLINSSVGGSPAESWMSRAALEANPE